LKIKNLALEKCQSCEGGILFLSEFPFLAEICLHSALTIALTKEEHLEIGKNRERENVILFPFSRFLEPYPAYSFLNKEFVNKEASIKSSTSLSFENISPNPYRRFLSTLSL
jgi:hypothetical protein